MFNKNKLKAALIEKGKTHEELADYLGMNISTLYRKMNGYSEFTRKEIQMTCEFLELESPMNIFFENKFA